MAAIAVAFYTAIAATPGAPCPWASFSDLFLYVGDMLFDMVDSKVLPYPLFWVIHVIESARYLPEQQFNWSHLIVIFPKEGDKTFRYLSFCLVDIGFDNG